MGLCAVAENAEHGEKSQCKPELNGDLAQQKAQRERDDVEHEVRENVLTLPVDVVVHTNDDRCEETRSTSSD